MGFFKNLLSTAGEVINSVAEKILNFTKKLIGIIAQSIRKVAMIIGKFFTLLTQWIGQAVNYVTTKFNVVVNGVQTFLKKVNNEYQEISYHYTKQSDGSYMKNTVVRQTFVSEDEIPADIKALALQMENNNMIDISNQTANKQEYACNELNVA
ncbi:MAG: hypothetical protein NC177_13440 [Ruminococcus flavefaciens]|nr:hypothetical protein [Ruminococcus flavefaciens]